MILNINKIMPRLSNMNRGLIKLNTDKSAAVNQQLVWISIDDHPPPVGAKLLLINRANGVAVLGTYKAKHQWTHWQGLPKFSEEHQ